MHDRKDERDQGEAFLFRHFVCIAWRVQPIDDQRRPHGPPVGQFASGCLFAYQDTMSILTAGHVLRHIAKLKASKLHRIDGCYLLDGFGHQAMNWHPIPFDFDGAAQFEIHDEEDGLDFGFVRLSTYYLKLLNKNGIKAITEENWRTQGSVEFSRYMMLGLPDSEATLIEERNVDGSVAWYFNVKPCAFAIRRLPKPPQESPETTYSRFVGQIDAKTPIKDISGMSGGPIFGFTWNEKQLLYWVVAIQSTWLPQRRITFGCPLPVIGGLLDGWVAAAARSSDDDHPSQ